MTAPTPEGQPAMYDGQLELEYTCVCCHRNTYPRRLMSGHCSDCITGDMTPEEMAAEAQEHEDSRASYRDHYLDDYARDVLDGKRTLKDAARDCCAELGEMMDAVRDLRQERADEDQYLREYLVYLDAERRAAHIHRAICRGAAHARKRRP